MAKPNELVQSLQMDQANESIRDMKRILEDQYKFIEMCRDLLNSIPEDLKE